MTSSLREGLVEVQEHLDGNLVVCSYGNFVPTQQAPDHAAKLRSQPAMKVAHSYIPANLLLSPQAPQGTDGRRSFSPWDDYAYRSFHRELIKAGMEHARKLGKHIGRPRILDREGFTSHLKEVLKRMQSGELSRRKAAVELSIGYATLKRLLDKPNQWEQNTVTDKIPQH